MQGGGPRVRPEDNASEFYGDRIRRNESSEPLTKGDQPGERWVYARYGSMYGVARRWFEVIADMPRTAQGYLLVITTISIITIVSTTALGGENRGTWLCLAVVYG
eukprot:Hpha_TRINITY_DN29111_c0_g1::TRINITY_DN29111_c0_g1_i1::g.195374::m.195374